MSGRPDQLELLEEGTTMSASSGSPNQLELLEEATAMSASSGESETLDSVIWYDPIDPADAVRSFYLSMRAWYELYVVDQKPGECKLIPTAYMILFPALFEKSWGYDRLYPYALDDWCPYHAYLKEFYRRNSNLAVGSEAYQLCLEKEFNLKSEWLTKGVNIPPDVITLSDNIQKCALQLIVSKRGGSSTATIATTCIAKETELIIERLRHGPSVLDPEEHPHQSTQIRQLALSYMTEEQGCQSGSDIAVLALNVALLGITKEAELMCENLRRGYSDSYEMYLNREIRGFALEVATEGLARFAASIAMAESCRANDEIRSQLVAAIEANAEQRTWRHLVGEFDCQESAPENESEKESGNENSEKKQQEGGMAHRMLAHRDGENTQVQDLTLSKSKKRKIL